MKKLICILLCILCLTGCTAPTPAEPDDTAYLAMYIPMGDGYLLIGEDGAPFTLQTMEGLSPADLSAGDMIAIVNPGDMAASYPGILYGYDRLELYQQGDPANVEQYRDILDSLTAADMPDDAPPDATLPDEMTVNRAMYVPYGDGNYVMIDELGQVFTVRFPLDMTTAEGEDITPESLTAGCIVDIYGNGVMLESYPGQYPGVERIVLVDRGDPADIEQYLAVIDELHTEPAPVDSPPALHLEYAIEDAIVYSQIRPANYNWEQDMGNGEIAAVVACGAHVLQSKELQQVYIDKPTDVLLTFPTYAPHTVTCIRWPESERRPDGGEVTAAGETVELALPVEPAGAEGSFDASLRKLTAEPGYVYLITAHWTEGSAEYGFHAES